MEVHSQHQEDCVSDPQARILPVQPVQGNLSWSPSHIDQHPDCPSVQCWLHPDDWVPDLPHASRGVYGLLPLVGQHCPHHYWPHCHPHFHGELGDHHVEDLGEK